MVSDNPTRYEQAKARIEENEKSLIDYIAHLEKEINAGSHKSEPDWALVQYLDIATHSLNSTHILKAVLELHGPHNSLNLYPACKCEICQTPQCRECTQAPFEVKFPCPTAEKIIEGVLGNE